MKKSIAPFIFLGILPGILQLGAIPKTTDLIIAPEPAAKKAIPAYAANPLTFYWIDVEGGAATLIVTPTGESVLIDSGNPGNRDADRIYQVAKNVAGLKQIDHLITTHWHIDHYGGAAELAKKMPIIEVHDKGIPDNLAEDKEFATRIEAYRTMAVKKRSRLRENQVLNLKKLSANLPALSMRIVGFDKKFTPATHQSTPTGQCAVPDKAPDTSDNANSTVLVLDYGPFRFFDGADLTWNIEKTLACPENIVGTVDVYQVNHHGLDQSNNPVLIKALAPTVSIMNNGARKGCGPETVTTLKNTPSLQANYQLHQNIRPDSVYNTAKNFIANLKENCKASYITLAVAANGQSYTVQIPDSHHSKTYKTKLARK
ncbi:ComEC/Rec2 family competence protein [Adhaeribacter pallidiroseus]|uniref:Metallo-beta-lactamase domain-containing protein n=1 Tax=Adhaeribacter pallidiroseus TaxID=2072847 RepID=A0A369QE75_9BACT|nr:MBL fold metallo-hydrolase [Adhaeribacter pallidiroseus]RDC63024.1 hypothetical protein AHMF7616_01623 [Adhaeribacter pallidiroseus]